MQPFSRETITDRRQPAVRWSAVVAGTAVALGLWMLLQLFGTGAALKAIDRENVDHLRGIGMGATAWSAVALLASMFVGGLLAGRLAGHHDDRVAGTHGALVWALTSIVGFLVITGAVSQVAEGWRERAAPAMARGTLGDLQGALAPVNARLRQEGKPEITVNDMIDASRQLGDTYDRDAFVVQLDEVSALNRAETDMVVRQLGDRAPDVVATARDVGEQRARAVEAADTAGNALLLSALALLLGLVAAVGGALLAARNMVHQRGLDAEPTHTTAPYPVAGTNLPENTERNPIQR
jgi:hypothetical protein